MAWVDPSGSLVNLPQTPQEAAAQGLNIWDLFLTNWGQDGDGAVDPNTFTFPVAQNGIFIPSVAGAAIGPLSSVDVCAVTSVLNPPSGVITYPLSKDRPLLHRLNGPIRVLSTVATPGIGASSPSAPVENYVLGRVTSKELIDITGALVPFGRVMASVNNKPVFVDPFLHLQFFLDTAPAAAPIRALFQDAVQSPFAGVTAETIIRVWPVPGRRHARITYRHISGGGTLTVRTTAAIYAGDDVDFTNFREIQVAPTVGTTTALAAGQHTVHALDNFELPFLIARVAAVGAAVTVHVGIEAYD